MDYYVLDRLSYGSPRGHRIVTEVEKKFGPNQMKARRLVEKHMIDPLNFISVVEFVAGKVTILVSQ